MTVLKIDFADALLHSFCVGALQMPVMQLCCRCSGKGIKMRHIGFPYFLTFILVVFVLFCGCDVKDSADEKKSEKVFSYQGDETLTLKDHLIQGNLAEISLYTREEKQQVTIAIPMVSDICFSSAEIDQSQWSFGDSELVSASCNMEKEYGGYYIYLLIIGMTYPSAECTMTSLPLLIDGQNVTYEFGKFYARDYGKGFYSAENEEDLYYRDNVFEVPDSTLETVPFFNMVSAKRTELKSISISSQALHISARDMEDVFGIHEAGEEFPVELRLENAKNPCYYRFETVILYVSENGEEVAIPSMCTTGNSPKMVAEAIVDKIK